MLPALRTYTSLGNHKNIDRGRPLKTAARVVVIGPPIKVDRGQESAPMRADFNFPGYKNRTTF